MKTAFADGDSYVSTEEFSDYSFRTKPFILPSGNYSVLIEYTSDCDGSAMVQGNNNCVFTIDLPATGGSTETLTDDRLILPTGTDKGNIKFYQKAAGEIRISKILIRSPKSIYYDYYAYIALAALVAAGLIVLILVYNRLRLSRVGLSYIGLLLIVLLLVNIPFLTKGSYYEIDTQGHMKRIEAVAQGIHDRQLPVLVGPNYANQYGELVALQPGLFLYFPAFLRLLNVSIPASYNIFMILINIATAVSAVICAERLFTSLRWSIVAAAIYLAEPFRLYVMMDLGAGAGMGIALIFLPFILVGMHDVVNRRGFRWHYLAIGLWGMISSHIMGFALSAVAIVIYLLFHFKKLFTKQVILALIKAALLFAVLSVGILAPFFGYYFTEWNKDALQWADFYHFGTTPDREILNLITVIIFLISLIGLLNRKLLTQFGRGIFITGFVSSLMALPVFPWFLFRRIGVVDAFLSMMQYPMRFHFLAAPCMAYVAAEAICAHLDAKTKMFRKITLSITALLFVSLVINFYDHYASGKLFAQPAVGEINTVMEDYLPAGTQSEWYATDTGEFSDYDAVEAYSYAKTNTHIDLTYTSKTDGQYMEFPLFYYKGYVAYDQNNSPLTVEMGGHNRVRVYLTRSDEVQELHLRFKVNRIYTVLFVFSLLACAVYFLYAAGRLGLIALRSGRVTRNDT
ncbi:MAG: hypothetical protein J5518_03685 [Lachnospiraceae bacterium]|nr:hypothetical protein [Lachnospiraceae bacterium]